MWKRTLRAVVLAGACLAVIMAFQAERANVLADGHECSTGFDAISQVDLAGDIIGENSYDAPDVLVFTDSSQCDDFATDNARIGCVGPCYDTGWDYVNDSQPGQFYCFTVWDAEWDEVSLYSSTGNVRYQQYDCADILTY
jgi:hypothetical protein